MADSKISALPSATTPLSGTELLPIVQGGATTKVAASAFQAPLVSGTNIKTINSASILGSGDLTVSASAGGSNTQVQFNDAGAFGGDAGLAFDKTTGKLTVGGKTVTASAPVLDLSQSWNAGAVTFTGIKFNVTSDVSASGSLLMDLQVGGVSKLKVIKSYNALGTGTGPALQIGSGGSADCGWIFSGTLSGYSIIYPTSASNLTTDYLCYFKAGTYAYWKPNTYFESEPTFQQGITVSVNKNIAFSNDLIITRDAANTLAQRNGVNAQTSRLYGTYTDASNYRRLTQTMSTGGVAEIKPEGAGTGASGNVLHISGLPTSNPGAGILWNDAGTVKVGT